MTYNLVARYIKKYGDLPYGTEVPFITKKFPGGITGTVLLINYKRRCKDFEINV